MKHCFDWKCDCVRKFFPFDFKKLFNINIVIQLNIVHPDSHNVWIYPWMRECFAWIWMQCAPYTFTFTAPIVWYDWFGYRKNTGKCAHSMFSFVHKPKPFFPISSIHKRHTSISHIQSLKNHRMENISFELIVIRSYDYHHINWFKLDQFQFNYCSI